MEPVAPAAPAAAPVAAPVAAPAPVEPAAPPVLNAHTEQPATPSAADLGALAQQTGGNPILTIALAAIAVLGGGAAWKHWQKVSEQKHEQAMEDKRLAAQEKGLSGAQPIPCQTVTKVQAEAITKLSEAVAAHDARIGAVEKKSKSMSADFDGDEATERLEKAEKAIRDLRKTLRDIKEGA
jgi:uncharacterized protein HemX